MKSTSGPSSEASAADTLPGEVVHKTEQSEVLLTGWRELGPDTLRVTARWPSDHGFYRSVHGLHDPLLIVESVRQAIPLLCHAVYGAPLGHRQSWSNLGIALDPAALAVTGSATEIELRIACSGVIRRAGRLAALTMSVEALTDGRHLATVQTSFTNHSPALYQRLRGTYADTAQAAARALPLLPPAARAQVGRDNFADVVLSPTDVEYRTQLRVDLAHPVLFDHPVDHVPGMLLLEAARQAAVLTAYPEAVVLTGLDCIFVRYTEFDALCTVVTDMLPQDHNSPDVRKVMVSAMQNGTCVFSAVATLAPATRH